jgi:hypothetical protein
MGITNGRYLKDLPLLYPVLHGFEMTDNLMLVSNITCTGSFYFSNC